jgi:predicted transcriptional regulator
MFRIFAKYLLYNEISVKELTAEQEQLARFAKALGHPVRIAIMQMLARKTCCHHGDMSERLPVAMSTLSQHLKELKKAGLIYQETITLPTIKYCICKKNRALAKQLFDGLLTEIEQSDD